MVASFCWNFCSFSSFSAARDFCREREGGRRERGGEERGRGGGGGGGGGRRERERGEGRERGGRGEGEEISCHNLYYYIFFFNHFQEL